MEYKTVSAYGDDFFIEKKSKFIGYCKPVTSEEQAKEFIAEIKQKHKDATHNVWAYSLRDNNIMRYNDDGEPSGTAGIPVLDVLKKSDTVDAVIVATRYFGGTLLGGGGLVRAYSHTASIAVSAAKQIMMRECFVISAKCQYTYYNKLQEICGNNNAVIDDTIFDDAVSIIFHILPQDFEVFKIDFSELTKGTGEWEELDRNFYGFPIN